MKYLRLFTFLWAISIIVIDAQNRGYGFTALACLALAALIIKVGTV